MTSGPGLEQVLASSQLYWLRPEFRLRAVFTVSISPVALSCIVVFPTTHDDRDAVVENQGPHLGERE